MILSTARVMIGPVLTNVRPNDALFLSVFEVFSFRRGVLVSLSASVKTIRQGRAARTRSAGRV